MNNRAVHVLMMSTISSHGLLKFIFRVYGKVKELDGRLPFREKNPTIKANEVCSSASKFFSISETVYLECELP
jgi:hypothetical protein